MPAFERMHAKTASRIVWYCSECIKKLVYAAKILFISKYQPAKKTKRKHYKLIYELNTKNELPIYTGQFTLCKRNITSRHVARS